MTAGLGGPANGYATGTSLRSARDKGAGTALGSRRSRSNTHRARNRARKGRSLAEATQSAKSGRGRWGFTDRRVSRSLCARDPEYCAGWGGGSSTRKGMCISLHANRNGAGGFVILPNALQVVRRSSSTQGPDQTGTVATVRVGSTMAVSPPDSLSFLRDETVAPEAYWFVASS